MSMKPFQFNVITCVHQLLMVTLQYGDAHKSNTANYLETILTSLERIEIGVLRLIEQIDPSGGHYSPIDRHLLSGHDHPKFYDDDEV